MKIRKLAGLSLSTMAITSFTPNTFAETFTSTDANNPLEETLVEGNRNSHVVDVGISLEINPDTAQLLRKAPGTNVNSNGPLTGIAQMRGMFGARIATQINGQSISAGGPNWMDPPLSYAPAAQLQNLTVYRGIAPVSAGQETLGGAIKAETWQGEFANTGVKGNGNLRLGGQSVNDSGLASANVAIASPQHKMKLLLLNEQGSDAEFPGGRITPSEYRRERIDLGYAFKTASQQFDINVAQNKTGDTGTPALPMDIEYIDSDLASIGYRSEGDIKWQAKLYASDIEHAMTNYHLRSSPTMLSMWRRNVATGENRGGLLSVKADSWNFGVDYHQENHNSDIDNPNAAAFFVMNFNNASRKVTGIYAEYQRVYDAGLQTELGLRVNRIAMDADPVDGTPAQAMPPAAVLRDNFNKAERNKSDTNLDAVLRLSFKNGFYAAAGQKSRSPSYQERYLWLPLEATAGLADGRVYIGNIELKPEVSRELELGYDVQTANFSLSPRIFYRSVKDYIQGTPSNNAAANMLVSMMAMNPYPPLQFNNVDAVFYGLDLDAQYSINSNWNIQALVNYVRGKRDDINDNLYRIAPLNATLALNLEQATWGFTAETLFVDGQKDISETQGEKTTPGYAFANLRAYWKFASDWQLGGGIDNVFDKAYQDHLSGYNRVNGSDIPSGDRLYAYGRNVYLRLDYRF